MYRLGNKDCPEKYEAAHKAQLPSSTCTHEWLWNWLWKHNHCTLYNSNTGTW